MGVVYEAVQESAGPARGAEGAARPPPGRPRRSSSGSAARRGRRPGCTTPTSCRSSASASTTGCTTTPCSSSRARASTPCSTRSSGCAAGGPGGPHPAPGTTPPGGQRGGRARSPGRFAPQSEARPRRPSPEHRRRLADRPQRSPTTDLATSPGSSPSAVIDPRAASGSSLFRGAWPGSGVQAAEALAYAHARGCCTATSSRPTSCWTSRGRSG